MSFADALSSRGFPVSLEITPPKASTPRILERRARLLGEAATAVNVIQRPGRQSSLDASLELLEVGIEPVWHLVTRGRTRAELERDLRAARTGGIRNVLCIRGDHQSGIPDELTVRDACEAACGLGGATIGATLNQYAPDRQAVIRNLLPKLRAGARYVQTQPVFEVEDVRPIVEVALERSPETLIVAMAMPLTSLEAAGRIEERLGIQLPASLRRQIGAGGAAGAWEAFDTVMARLAESPLIAGVAIMTFEMDPSPETGARIVASLRTARQSTARP
jgi:methylenetetrahydrofolate reductase (NADPH)